MQTFAHDRLAWAHFPCSEPSPSLRPRIFGRGRPGSLPGAKEFPLGARPEVPNDKELWSANDVLDKI